MPAFPNDVLDQSRCHGDLLLQICASTADALGSTIGVASGSSVAASYTYDPFGATTADGDDAGNATQFTGREDEGNGLYYYRNRFYSTTQQRFLSPDPLGLASGGTDPYTYVQNQPTTLVDPMGTKPQGSCDETNSFVAGTPVLMADGTTKSIETIKPGDRVMAADPTTGQRKPETVTAGIVGNGDKTLVTITTADGGTVTATDGHPFWVDDDGNPSTLGGRWVDAIDLRHGDWLKTSDGHLVRVAGTHSHQQHAYAYNLTVKDLHTYYVEAGATPVLVHNIDQDCINWSAKSVKTFGHTFSDHGKSVAQLADRARLKQGPQGRWINPAKAAEFMRSVWTETSGAREVNLPEGLGEVVFEDGSTVPAVRARLVQRANSMYKTAFPILEDGRGGSD